MEASFATEDFPWTGGEDDFICVLGDYTLRVEQMGDSEWWFRVYFKDEVLTTDEHSTSKYRAIGNCEGIYLGHKAIN